MQEQTGFNKKGGAFVNLLFGGLLFSLVIVGFYTLPAKSTGFWSAYQYTPPLNTLSTLDKTTNYSRLGTDIKCDLDRVGSCDSSGTTANIISKFTKLTDFINSMVSGAYGGVITIFKSFTVVTNLIETSSNFLNIPPELFDILIAMVIIFISIAALLLIFNRSDTL